MNPRHGEVWLVDMGLAAKTRPAAVLIADNLDAPRSLIIHIGDGIAACHTSSPTS